MAHRTSRSAFAHPYRRSSLIFLRILKREPRTLPAAFMVLLPGAERSIQNAGPTASTARERDQCESLRSEVQRETVKIPPPIPLARKSDLVEPIAGGFV